jgi:tRNA G18 (ribose-2'-O)-methylase SpoU
MKVPPLDYPTHVVREELDRLRHPLRVAVVRSKNPFNVGAIIRTAHSFLVREIVLIGDAPYYERASMGMEKYENILCIATEEQFLDRCRRQGWKLVVFEKEHARVGLWEAELPEQTIMLFGNEDFGVSRLLLDAAHIIVGVPMFGINHSYPVSVVAGIAMAEWARRYYRGGRLVLPH